MNETQEFQPSDHLIQIADAYVERLRSENAPSIDAFVAEYPQHADELRRYLPLVLSMEKQTVVASDCDTETDPRLPIAIDLLPVGLNRYQIRRMIGRGNMGAVYEARDLELDRTVALKIPQFEHASRRTMDRFYREARAMATIDHPHICAIYDVAEVNAEDVDVDALQSLVGRPYLTMACLAGTSLAECMKEQTWDAQEAARLVATVADALHAAHLAGVIHRDVKPANIILDEDRTPILMDFGLARREQAEEVDITLDGQLVGSPAYMSPEQIGNRSKVGPGTDIYSLGIVLYELLCGQRPFLGSQLTLLRDICWAEPPRPRELRAGLAPELEAICLKAIAKDPEQRYTSAQAFATDLQAFAEGGRPVALAGQRHKRPWLAPLALTLVACSAIAAVIAWPSPSRPPNPPSETPPPATRPAAIDLQELQQKLAVPFWDHYRFRRFETQEPDISAHYAQTFASYGITREETSARDLEVLLEAQPAAVREELLIGLESWLSCVARTTEDVPSPWLRDLLEYNHADHTPLRTAILELDRDRLSVLVHQYALEHHDPRLAVIWNHYLRKSDKEISKLILAKATEAYPDNPFVHTSEGVRRKESANFAGAVRSFREALKHVENPELWTHLGMSFLGQKKYREAEEALQKAIALDPEYGTAYFVLGKLYFLEKRTDLAIETLSTALDKKCNFTGQAYRYRAIALVSQGRVEDAMKDANHAIAMFRERTYWRNIMRLCKNMLDGIERYDEHGFVVQRYRLIQEHHNATRQLRQPRRLRAYMERLLADLRSSEDDHQARITRLQRLLDTQRRGGY